MAELEISESRRLRGLGTNQRRALLDKFGSSLIATAHAVTVDATHAGVLLVLAGTVGCRQGHDRSRGCGSASRRCGGRCRGRRGRRGRARSTASTTTS